MKRPRHSIPSRLSPAILAVMALLALPPARAENWPQWRGPRGDGTSLETGVPTSWAVDRNIVWKTEIPGEGRASASVWGNRVFTVTAVDDGHERLILCLDAADGHELWRRTAIKTAEPEHIHQENSHATGTPATDGERVATTFSSDGRATVQCWDMDGNELWRVAPLEFKVQHGYGHSVVIDGDLVYLNCNQYAEPALLALDKRTGETKWRFDYPQKSGSYVTPLFVEYDGRRQMVVAGANFTRSFDPASGEQLWFAMGPAAYCVASLAYGDGIVLAHGGYPQRDSLAIRVDGTGDVTANKLWTAKKGASYVPSPIYANGHFFNVDDNGIGFCWDAATGETKWQERMGGNYRTSLLLIEGLLHTTNTDGRTTVFRATPEKLDVVATSELPGLCYATPAVSGGRLFQRSGGVLYCIGKQGE